MAYTILRCNQIVKRRLFSQNLFSKPVESRKFSSSIVDYHRFRFRPGPRLPSLIFAYESARRILLQGGRRFILSFSLPFLLDTKFVQWVTKDEKYSVIPDIDLKMDKSIRDLMLAALLNNTEDIERLIKQGVDPNSRHALGWTALHVAAFNGNIEAVETLLDNGASIDAIDEFVCCDSVVMKNRLRRLQIEFEHLPLDTNFFFSRDAYFHLIWRHHTWRQLFSNILVDSCRGMTPLHYAVLMGRTDVLRLLISRGANPIIENDCGHLAVDYSLDDATRKMLLDYKMKLNLPEKPRSSSLQNRFTPITVLLILLRSLSKLVVTSPRRYAGIDDDPTDEIGVLVGNICGSFFGTLLAFQVLNRWFGFDI